MPKLTESQQEAERQAESDARTLAEANVILNDDKRLKAAKKAATKLVEGKDAQGCFARWGQTGKKYYYGGKS